MSNYDYFNTWGYVDGVGNYIALSSKNINEEEIQDIVDKSFNTTELKSEGQELQLSINGKNVSTVTIEDKYLQDVKFNEITKELIFTVDDGSDVLKIDLTEALSEFATKKDIEDKINNLVDNAPEALNTLIELSNALGNDPNFATTVSNELAKKVDKTEVYTKIETDNLFQPKGNYLTEHQDISNLATKDDVKNIIDTIPSIDGLATETYVNEQIDLIPPVDLSEYAKTADINNELLNKVDKDLFDETLNSFNENIDKLNKEVKNSVKYQEFNENRKTIQLNNYDNISGIDTHGIGHNLVMLSKWDVADFGSGGVKINFNGSEERPTYNDNKEIALFEDVNNIENQLSNYITKQEVSDNYQIKGNYLTEHQSLENYPTKDELKTEINKTVQFTTTEYQGRTKKVITLDNDELVNARSNSEDLENKIDVNGKTISLIQLNRWNVVDLGSPYTLTNINTPDGVRPTIQEKSQSGPEAHKIAYLSDFENINDIVNSLSTNVEMLQMKLDAINKSNIEIVEISNDVIPEMTDVTKDYIISGDINTSANISGKSITLNNVSISNDARLKLNANDIEIRDLNLNGDFPKANGNSVVQINNAEFVLFKDMVFDSNNVYNGIEIGLSKTATQQAKNIIFENCQFKGEFANNAILIFTTDNNSVITLNNCHFDKVSNALRISNKTNSKNVVININNCTIDGWDSNPEYQGFIIFEDYTNKTEEDVNANNLFAPEKITVNINNLIYQGEKLVPTDIASVCGTANENQIIYVYADAIGLIAYDSNKYPNISFN